jgi:transcriptional regulator with GAF, ATPase, and Fis domain
VSDRAVRISVLCGLALAALFAWEGNRGLEARLGQAYPGFYVLASGVVAPPVGRASGATIAAAGLRALDRIESIDGRAIQTSEDVYAAARAAGPGVVLRYGVRSALGAPREVAVETRLLTPAEAPWLPLFFGVGTLVLLIGAAPALVRPDLRGTQLFFAFCWAASCNFAFLAPDHVLVHRLQPASFAVSAFAMATLIHLGLTFPQPRRPLRGEDDARIGWLYAAAAAGFAGFALLSRTEPLLTHRAAIAGFSSYVLGAAALFGNVLAAALRPRDALVQRRARLVLNGVGAASCAAATLTALGGFGASDVAFAAFLAIPVAFPAAIAWAAFQHELFDLDTVMRRGLAVGAAALVASLAYLGAFTWLRRVFGVETAWASAALSLALLAAVVPLSQPLRRRLQRFVDRVLFPERTRARRAVLDAARALARVRDRAGVAALVADAARSGAGAAWAALVAGPADGALQGFGPADAAGVPGGASGCVSELAATHPLVAAIRRGEAVQRSAPEASARGTRVLQRAMEERGVERALPLPAEPGRLAALLVGPRADGRPYTREDRRTLSTLAAQAALALRNAEAFDELAVLGGRLRSANVALRREIARHQGFEEIIGEAPGIGAAREQIAHVAKTDATVLILGETGTGKELVVRALHRLSDRAERPLVKVACAAIPETLVESELFGHERGAFTGAQARRIGRFELADGGTLFLDDVDTLPLPVQAKLLRAIQEGEVQRLGSNELRRVDVRFVAATNRDLKADIRAGRFREDLYYRLHVVPVRLPPLRERRDDIPLLVQHFVDTESARLGREPRPIEAASLEALCAYDWPGNVRELRNVLERAIVMSRGDVVRVPWALGARGAAEPGAGPDPRPLAERLREFKRERLRAALALADGNQTQAAESLGLHRQSFARMLKELGVTPAGGAAA